MPCQVTECLPTPPHSAGVPPAAMNFRQGSAPAAPAGSGSLRRREQDPCLGNALATVSDTEVCCPCPPIRQYTENAISMALGLPERYAIQVVYKLCFLALGLPKMDAIKVFEIMFKWSTPSNHHFYTIFAAPMLGRPKTIKHKF